MFMYKGQCHFYFFYNFFKGNCQSTNLLDTKAASSGNQKPVVISASVPMASSNSQHNGTDGLPEWMVLAKTFMESMIQKFQTPSTISNLTR